MSGWGPLTCRACLATDVKLYNIHESGLAGIYAKIAGEPVAPSDGLPQGVCFYCRAQIIRFQQFRSRCRRTMMLFRNRACMVIRTGDLPDGSTSPNTITMIRMRYMSEFIRYQRAYMLTYGADRPVRPAHAHAHT